MSSYTSGECVKLDERCVGAVSNFKDGSERCRSCFKGHLFFDDNNFQNLRCSSKDPVDFDPENYYAKVDTN